MPVRSKLQERKALEAARERAVTAQLAAHQPPKAAVENAQALAFDLAMRHPTYVVRDPRTFTRRIRSRDAGKLRLAAAEHVFGRYPAPRHLRSVWHTAPSPAGPGAEARASEQQRFRKELYLVCVTGGSVHKRLTHRFMTKGETHRFLTLAHTASFVEAVWFTLARSFTDDPGVAHRMSVSRLAEQPYDEPFWREVLRFFCLNPVPIARVNDTIDFLRQQHGNDPAYTVRGRTLKSLSEQVEQWHRALNRARRMGRATWPGVDLPDAVFPGEEGLKRRRFDWTVTQIKSSQDLAEEGTKMHHCVYSYQAACIAGRASIWSLKVRPADPRDSAPWSRALTIEMDNAARRLVQLRGYANRGLNPDERLILQKWAASNGLSIAPWA